MPAPDTLPRGTGASSFSSSPQYFDSPNFSQANRARARRARTAANSRARNVGRSTLQRNTRRAANLRNARTQARTPTSTPQIPNPAAPTAPKISPAAAPSAAASTGAAANAALWTASPAAAPATTAALGVAALGIGLGAGNAIYEEVLDRPFGPSLGDYLATPRETPQRDGPSDDYLAPGEGGIEGGQTPGILYVVSVTVNRYSQHDGSLVNSVDAGQSVYGPVEAIYTAKPNLGDFLGGTSLGYVVEAHGSTIGFNNVRRLQTEKLGVRYSARASAYEEEVGGTFVGTSGGGGGLENEVLTLTNVSIVRADGEPDTGGNRPGTPQPAPGREPFRPRPLQPAPPSGNPLTSTPTTPLQPQPELQPIPQPPATPFPNARPDPNETPNPLPFVPPIPARAPSPTATPTPTPSQPPNTTPPPRSSRQRPNCGCNAGIIAGVGRQLDPIRQAQQAQITNAATEAASTGLILERLASMQQFAEKAWSNTRLQKLINYLTLISVLHNAAMLSRDVGETMGELTSNMLAAIGLKDENGSPIDINELVGSSVESFIKSVVGEDIYNDVSTAWQKSSRIVSSAAMIVYTVRSINDTSKDILEWSAENLGKIGNALKRFGVVGERSYPWMAERVKAQDAYRRKFQRVTDGLEDLEDTASSLSVVTSNVREIQDEFNDLGQQQTAFKDLVSDTFPTDTPTSAPENEPILDAEAQINAQSESSDVAIADAQRGGT